MEKAKTFTVRIPEEVHRKVKVMAADTGQTMTQIILDCVERKFTEYMKSQK